MSADRGDALPPSRRRSSEPGLADEVARLRRETAKLRRRCAAAERVNEANALFFATVAHEIREPMNGVLGMARVLLDTPLGHEQRGYVEAVIESGEALLTVVNDVLDLSRMEAGRLELATIAFSPNGLANSVQNLFAGRAAAKGIGLELTVEETVPPILRGDPGRLRQILVNLVGNAVKFTTEGGVRVTLGADTPRDGRVRLRIEVHDTGIGIPTSRKEALFTAYAQADPSIQRLYGGSGLGLTICKRLVDRMGGRIEVTSTQGQGSLFAVELPLALPGSDDAAEPSATGDLAGTRVLVVDPDEPTRTATSRLLAAWGVLVASAARGAAALDVLDEAAANGRPAQMVLIDHGLPDMSGEQLGRHIRARPALADARLIMVAAGGMRGDAARVAAIGFQAYLPKPLTAQTLLDGLTRVRAGGTGTSAGELVTVHSLSETRPGPLRILLADDHPVNCRLACIMLEKAGHEVVVVGDGRAALDRLRRDAAFDVVLMDVQMPVMGGLEAARAIRALPGPAGRVPIVAVTAQAMKGDGRRCLEAGMDDYITKPIDRAGLLGKVTHWGAGGEGAAARARS